MIGRSVTLSTSLARATTQKCAVLICILSQWPGYDVWKRQRQARDDTYRRDPITLAKFAQHVGRCVSELLQVCYTEPRWCRLLTVLISKQDYEERPTLDPKWRIGRGGILPNEVLVLGAVHVSSGTWQPILALTKVVM